MAHTRPPLPHARGSAEQYDVKGDQACPTKVVVRLLLDGARHCDTPYRWISSERRPEVSGLPVSYYPSEGISPNRESGVAPSPLPLPPASRRSMRLQFDGSSDWLTLSSVGCIPFLRTLRFTHGGHPSVRSPRLYSLPSHPSSTIALMVWSTAKSWFPWSHRAGGSVEPREIVARRGDVGAHPLADSRRCRWDPHAYCERRRGTTLSPAGA